MNIIDRKELLAALAHIRRCELCDAQLMGDCEFHHYQTRGIGGGSQLDVPFGVVVLCTAFGGNACHQRFHDGNIPRERMLAAIVRRTKLHAETITQALQFLRWVPSRPRAGEVEARFDQLGPKAQDLVWPYVKELF